MSQYLPVGDFNEIQFVRGNIERILINTILRTLDNEECEYLLECDLEDSCNMHENIKHFTLLPGKKTIKEERFPSFLMENKPENHKPSEKLPINPENKQRCSLKNRGFIFYIKLGIRVLKTHTVYRFTQSPCTAKCFKNSTEQRSKAEKDFEKHFYKLMNSFFQRKGEKTLEKI